MTTKQVRLDIRDLPRDPQYFQGPLRIQLVKMANYVRKYPSKADSLVTTLEFVLEHLKKNIEGVEVKKPAELSVVEKLVELSKSVSKKKKEEVVMMATKVGLELDPSKKRSDLDKELKAKYAELIKLQEGK